MTRRLRVEWSAGRKVDALVEVVDGSRELILLAHGAGAGQRHSFMVGLRRALTGRGFSTMTFDYPYVAEGRKAPDRVETLLACHKAVLRRAAQYGERLVLAGKSMGGRMASHLAAESENSHGLVVYGYPLVALGKSEPRDTSHLDDAGPTLLISGARDRMAPLELLQAVALRSNADLVLVEDADHGFRVPKRTGLDQDAVLARLADETALWVRSSTTLR